jgi:hypothetical protein
MRWTLVKVSNTYFCNQCSHSGTHSFLNTFDHFDYFTMIAQEYSYCLSMENFLIIKFQNMQNLLECFLIYSNFKSFVTCWLSRNDSRCNDTMFVSIRRMRKTNGVLWASIWCSNACSPFDTQRLCHLRRMFSFQLFSYILTTSPPQLKQSLTCGI